MNTIVAIDVSKDKSSFCIWDSIHSPKDVHDFPMTKEGFNHLLESIRGTEHPQFFMESTGRYHLTLLNFLLNQRQTAFIVNPILIKNYSKVHTLRKTKTDSVDARLIADFANAHTCPLREAEYGLNEEIRSLARRREELAEDVAKAKTRVKADLCVSFPEILSVNIFTDSMLSLLCRFSSPEAILQASSDELSTLLNAKRKGRKNSISVDQIQNLAKESVGIESYGPLACDSVRNLMSIQEREQMISKAFMSYIKENHKKEQQILQSIPGIGEITSAHFIAEIGDIRKFPRYQNLIAYCGTDPGIYESGTIQKRGHITKRGNRCLRKYVYLMAMGTIKFCPYFRSYYDRKREAGFPHRKAMVALMNKLLKTIFAILTKEEMYVSPDAH